MANLQQRPAQQPRFQQTRFQQSIAQASGRLQRWATNPWRRLSLQLIVLLMSFSIGGVVASISGQLSQIDPVGAVICVLVIELAIRARGPLLRQADQRLGLQLLDMGRVGLLYGLLLDGFKLL
ncbi:DUF565 domain-containing protein [Cyanobium sp. LEGE 06143]|uniref:DUF565 domain-containing protein n=1 Tax=Cyanobium sp. LEGE 06143 TaxID=945727 RepID=UPI00187F5027|nr:DUF565 domain-containing protein [Cyanobium sp. LEGE 06143]